VRGSFSREFKKEEAAKMISPPSALKHRGAIAMLSDR
jgi:hypothetical protein